MVARILLVEGDDAEAHRMTDALRDRPDWSVNRARTLLAAIRMAGESRFDAAILDSVLPDGSGLDIFDLLRITSPGIHIVLVADRADERLAFHALSHGAGDLVEKGRHLDEELPRRVGALLDAGGPAGALVETLATTAAYDARRPEPGAALARPLDGILGALEKEGVLAAGVFDPLGKVVAFAAPAHLDGARLGFAIATIHGQVGALWTYASLKPTGYRLLIDVDGGSLAMTAIPGTYVIALLFETGVPARRALDAIDDAGLRVLAALDGGSAGDDLASG